MSTFQVTFKAYLREGSVSAEYQVKQLPRVDDVVRLHGALGAAPHLVQCVEHDIKPAGEHTITVHLKRLE